MVALYGATAEVHDYVTRTHGSFEMTMRGFAYLKEAGAKFVVQLIPMRANYHQWDAMVTLAESLSPQSRVGAPWLFLSCDRLSQRNAEIAAQRLSPRDVIDLDAPNPAYEERMEETCLSSCRDGGQSSIDDGLFAKCIASRRDFHIDPYGQMTFCCFIKDPVLRYGLREGTFQEAWEKFIPSLAKRVQGEEEYRAHCGTCAHRQDCRWCAAYAYLETGRYSAHIPYLCTVAEEAREFKIEWQKKHRRYFQIAGITVRVETDLDLEMVKFKPEMVKFSVAGPGDDNVTIRHYFELPDMNGKKLGKQLYRKSPWVISFNNGKWYYLGISSGPKESEMYCVAVYNADYTHATIYNSPREEALIRDNGFHSLSLFPTDQIWLTPLLADRSAVLLHSSAVILNGQGLLFVGHSEAGKSTTVKMLKALPNAAETSHVSVEVLCDDRNIVRRWDAGWRVHGTWSHGELPDVSPSSAPLRAVLFLEKAEENAIVPMTDRKDILQRLLGTLIKALVTASWWKKELDVVEQIVREVPCYRMKFDKSSAIAQELLKLASSEPAAPGDRRVPSQGRTIATD
jgi:hypothetical protein